MEPNAPSKPSCTDALRRWRASEARRRNLPAYRVLTNATIDELARTCPRTPEGLQAVPGIGPVTASLYADAILGILAAYEPPTPGPVPTLPVWDGLPDALAAEGPDGVQVSVADGGVLRLSVPILQEGAISRGAYEQLANQLAHAAGGWVFLPQTDGRTPPGLLLTLSLLPTVEVKGRRARLRAEPRKMEPLAVAEKM